MSQASTRLLLAALLISVTAAHSQAPVQTNTTLLVNVDHRPATSLNGDWHAIVDQYATGLYDFHQNLRKDGFFMNAPSTPPGTPRTATSPTTPPLKCPATGITHPPTPPNHKAPIAAHRNFDEPP